MDGAGGVQRPAGTFRRLGARLGLLDTKSVSESDQGTEPDKATELGQGVPPESKAPPASPAPEPVTPTTSELAGQETHDVRPWAAPQSGLENLSTVVSEHPGIVLVPRPVQPVLGGKSVAIIGFSRPQQKAMEDIVRAQSGIPVSQAHQDASTVSFRWPHCDLLMVMAPPEWAV